MNGRHAGFSILFLAFVASCGARSAEVAPSASDRPVEGDDRLSDEQLQVAFYAAEIDELEAQLVQLTATTGSSEAQNEPAVSSGEESAERRHRERRQRLRTDGCSPSEAEEVTETSAQPPAEPPSTSSEEVAGQAASLPAETSLAPGEDVAEQPASLPQETSLAPGEDVARQPASLPGETSEQLHEAVPDAEPEPATTCNPLVCELRDRICDLALRICVISDRNPQDDDLDDRCNDAWNRCHQADRQVVEHCRCSGFEPALPG